MDYALIFLGQNQWFKVKKRLDGFVYLHKMLIDGLEWCGLSAVWTLILTAPIHCRGSIGEQMMEYYISPNLF